jgi:hypothetical protein
MISARPYHPKTYHLLLALLGRQHGDHESRDPQKVGRDVMEDQAKDGDDARDRNALDCRDEVPPEPDGEEIVPYGHLRDIARFGLGDEILAKGIDGLEAQESPDGEVATRGAEVADPTERSVCCLQKDVQEESDTDTDDDGLWSAKFLVPLTRLLPCPLCISASSDSRLTFNPAGIILLIAEAIWLKNVSQIISAIVSLGLSLEGVTNNNTGKKKFHSAPKW